jgi:hypothetical protein
MTNLIVDSYGKVENWVGTNNTTFTVDTSLGNDALVLCIAFNNPTSSAQTVSSVTALGLTFYKRSSGSYVRGSNTVNFECWWAGAGSALVGDIVTITATGTVAYGAVIWMAVNGVYSISSPWDTNASLAQANISSTAPHTAFISTDQAYDMVLAFALTDDDTAFLPSGNSPPAQRVAINAIGSPGNGCYLQVGYWADNVTRPQSSLALTVSPGQAGGRPSILVGDALTALSGISSPAGTIYTLLSGYVNQTLSVTAPAPPPPSPPTPISLPIFPVLKPLAWPMVKVPSFTSTVITAVTGRECQLIRGVFPIWTFTLTYGGDSWLREQTQNITPDPRRAGQTELEQISGIFLACLGSYKEFYYSDPQDCSRDRVYVGTGDGLTTTFQIYYTWGNYPAGNLVPPYSFYAPVGGIDSIQMVYFNTTHQDPATYYLDVTNTKLIFVSPPTAGTHIFIDYYFYFRCRFLNDLQEYEQWALNLWEHKELKFQSVKP